MVQLVSQNKLPIRRVLPPSISNFSFLQHTQCTVLGDKVIFVQAVKHIIIPIELPTLQCIFYSDYHCLSSSHSFVAFFAQQTYFTMATLGYYPQPTINAIDEIAALKQQFWRQVQQPKQPKQNHVQRSASPPRRNSNPITRGLLLESHLAIGSIIFVLSKDPSKKNCTCVIPNCQRRHLDDKGYNHPAVVLDIQDERSIGGELTALCCIVSHPVPDQLRYKL
jgi:hypothetical protein